MEKRYDIYIYIKTAQQKKLCMVKIAICFQPWQIAHWIKPLMKIHVIFQMVNQTWNLQKAFFVFPEVGENWLVVRRAGLLWSQQDFEWRWSVPLFKCLTALEFSFILFDLCLSITFFNFIMNYVPIVTFWISTYHKIWILSIMFCFIWSYWIIYFLACLEVSWSVVS